GVGEGQVGVILDRAGELPVYELDVGGQLRSRGQGLGREAAQRKGGHSGQDDLVVVDIDADAGARSRSEGRHVVGAVAGNRADQQRAAADGGLVIATTRRHDPGVRLLVGAIPAWL